MYNLSRDRISFIHLIDLPFTSSKPGGSTIGRFRNSLLKRNRYGKLLNLFNQPLENSGLLVKKGVAVDATLVPSCRHPRKKIDLETVPHDRKEDEKCNSSDQGEPVKQDVEVNSTITPCNGRPQERVVLEGIPHDCKEDEKTEPVKGKVSYSDDHDTTWTKTKGNLVYGLKINGIVDLMHGFILGGHATGANVSDITEFCRVVAESDLPKDSVVQADKGYAANLTSRPWPIT